MTNIFVFEGADGSGKDYLMNSVYQQLRDDGVLVDMVPKMEDDDVVNELAVLTGRGDIKVLDLVEKILKKRLDYLSFVEPKPDVALVSRWYPSTYVYQYYISNHFIKDEFMKAYEIMCNRLDKSVKLRKMSISGYIWRDPKAEVAASRIQGTNLYDRIATYMPEEIKNGYTEYFTLYRRNDSILRVTKNNLTEEDIANVTEFIKVNANIPATVSLVGG